MASPVWLYILFGLLSNYGCSSENCSSVESCSAAVRGLHYFSHQLREFHDQCQFIWTNRAAMIDNLRNRLKYRGHKQFLRFKAPVYYLDEAWTWKQASDEFNTWVSVADSHEYMLHFPHNFNVLSLGSMGIITNDFWGPTWQGKILGYCERTCARRKFLKLRCTLSWKDIHEFMSNVTMETKQEWKYVCLQLDYDVTDVIRNPNLAIPDVFYYWRFLRQLLSKRPYLGISISKDDFVHYNCFDSKGHLKNKEIIRTYFVILIIATILWLYSPLLIYFFPSSKPTTINYPRGLNHKDFCPTYRSPVYFGNFVRYILCFYMKERKGIKSRIRRFVFVSCSFVVSIRLLFTPYQNYFAVFCLTSLVASLVPEFLSVYLRNKVPTHFLGLWKYPEGVFRENTRKKEYQFLAHCMQERIYLVTDQRFWEMLVKESFKAPFFSNTWTELYKFHRLSELVLSVFVCVITFALAISVTIVFYLTPAFYFYKELFLAICTGTKDNVHKAWHGNSKWRGYNIFISIICFVHGVILTALLIYFIFATMFCCYLLAEVSMFTYIGAVLLPTMAFRYIALVGSVSFVLYKIAKDLRENYDKLRDQIVKMLENSDDLVKLNNICATQFEREVDPDGTVRVVLKTDPQRPKVMLYRDHFATYLSRTLLNFCIEACDPLRRRIMLIIVEVFVMTFYVLAAMWVKNVFHKEKEVSAIFTIAQTTGMYLVPSLLQFLAHRSHFGKKDDVLFHLCVHEAIVGYVAKQ